MRQQRAIEAITRMEQRGLRFKLEGDLIVIVTLSQSAPGELRQLVEKLGGDDIGTPQSPGIVGVLMPYVLSALQQRDDVEKDVVVPVLRGTLGFSPEYGWGTVVERDSDGRIHFATAERSRQLSLHPNKLVLIVSEEQLRTDPNGETKPTTEDAEKPKRSFWEYFRGAASGKAD